MDSEVKQPVELEKASKGCQDIYDKVYKRVKDEGGNEVKARAYARVALANCETKGKGDPP